MRKVFASSLRQAQPEGNWGWLGKTAGVGDGVGSGGMVGVAGTGVDAGAEVWNRIGEIDVGEACAAGEGEGVGVIKPPQALVARAARPNHPAILAPATIRLIRTTPQKLDAEH